MDRQAGADSVVGTGIGDPSDPPAGRAVGDERRHPGRRMTRGGVLAPLCGALVVIGSFLGWSLVRFGSPRDAMAYLGGRVLTAAPQTIELGAVRVGEERRSSVALRNLTGRAIHLIGANTTCNCTATQGLPATIEGGGARTLPVTIEVRPGVKSIDQAITFLTDDADHPGITIHIKGEVID